MLNPTQVAIIREISKSYTNNNHALDSLIEAEVQEFLDIVEYQDRDQLLFDALEYRLQRCLASNVVHFIKQHIEQCSIPQLTKQRATEQITECWLARGHSVNAIQLQGIAATIQQLDQDINNLLAKGEIEVHHPSLWGADLHEYHTIVVVDTVELSNASDDYYVYGECPGIGNVVVIPFEYATVVKVV